MLEKDLMELELDLLVLELLTQGHNIDKNIFFSVLFVISACTAAIAAFACTDAILSQMSTMTV